MPADAPIEIVERVYSENAPEAAQQPAAEAQALSQSQQQNISEETTQSTQQKQKEQVAEMLKKPLYLLVGLAIAALYAFFIFGFVAYLQARIGNLVWNNTKLDQLSFISKLRARDFIWLYFSNLFACGVYFGFFITDKLVKIHIAHNT